MKSTSPRLQKKIKELSKLSYKAITLLPNCKSCGTCIKFCPLNIRKFNDKGKAITITTDYICGGCSVCYHRCPNNVIRLISFRNS